MPITTEYERMRAMARGDTELAKRSKSIFERDLGTSDKRSLVLQSGNTADPDAERRKRLGQASYSPTPRPRNQPQPDLGPYGYSMITNSSIQPSWFNPENRWGSLRNRNRYK